MKIIFLIIVFCAESLFADRSFKIDYERKIFVKDGEPFRYISGEIHYNRIHPNQWNDRLSRLRAAGLNAIQVYVPWNLHETFEGNYDFSGVANLTRFFQLAQSNNLLVLLRPGPYICAEWENGGLPYWLLKKDNIKLRQYNQPYLDGIKRWFNKLFSMLQPLLYKNGGPIIMIQLENEYGSQGACDHNYTAFLRDLVRSFVGDDFLLYTVDSPQQICFTCGTIDGVFSTIDFGPTNFEQIKKNFELQQKYAKGGPIVNTEFYPGWFTTWGQLDQSKIPALNASLQSMKDMWNMNASFSIYMFHGGSNFGFWSGAEVYAPLITSYDYSAPVKENGDITPLYKEIAKWIGTLTDYDSKPQSTPFDFPSANYGTITLSSTATTFIDGIQPAISKDKCVTDPNPKSFENLDHPYGFVLYSTVVSHDGDLLDCSRAADHVFVFLNKNFKGMLLHDYNFISNLTVKIGAKKGDVLNLLVENRGRVNYPAIIDKKGLFPDVILDSARLMNWTSCPVDLSASSPLLQLFPPKSPPPSNFAKISPPLIWQGSFQINDIKPRDTFFNPTGFLKGVVFVNGFNLGRYWPTAGPQVTLYVPSPILQSGKNNITVIELFGNYQSTVELVDKPIYRYK